MKGKVNKIRNYCQNYHLDTNNVNILLISVNICSHYVHNLFQELSNDEKKRVFNYCFESDRIRYIIGRGILKTIVGYYLGSEPNNMEFCYGKYGKPYIADRVFQDKIFFNMSYAKNIILYAFSRNDEVGIDIEQIRTIPDMEKIVEYFFSEKEKIVFSIEPESSKKELFFRLWTRKEAYLKGVGVGLTQSEAIDEIISTGDQCDRLVSKSDKIKVGKWIIHDLKMIPSFAAACAVENNFSRFQIKIFPNDAYLF